MPGRDDEILARIEERRPDRFPAGRLGLPDCFLLLEILLSVHSPSSSIDLKQCEEYVSDHLDLIHILRDAYASNSFSSLINHPLISSLTNKPQDADIEPGLLVASGSNGSFQSAFTGDYQGDGPQNLIEVLNSYSRSNHPLGMYNRSISIIQSSGMGKSRLVNESAKEVFTIPANLREELPDGVKTYPPPDEELRWYFESHEGKGDNLLQADKVVEAARKEIIGISEQVRVGTQYHAVLPSTDPPREVSKSSGQVQLHSILKASVSLEKLFRNMRRSAMEMLAVVAPGHSSRNNVCFVYFDEAHNLTKPPRVIEGVRYRSPYHNLGTVLAELSNLPIFFIFLSTNTHLQQLAPPASHHPSARAFQGTYLIPPFTELPFDVFTTEMFARMKESKQLRSLANACTTQVMSSMGRPLWFAHHTQWLNSPQSDQKLDHVIEFAMQKLTANMAPEHVSQSEVAALSIRIGITFESTTHASRDMESRLVESHMRVVYAIPQHREFMRTGSSSEPVLAEAAAQYLKDRANGGIALSGPRILSENCQKGFIARGERGELCGRLLMTAAHDLALSDALGGIPRVLNDSEVIFHRPVPVLTFLRALFADRHHVTILEATPATDDTGEKLQDAFKEAYVSFSHFVQAGDSAMLGAKSLRTALFRGMAIQAKDNQVSIDAVIPIYMGLITSSITTKTTSNRKHALPCTVNRSITVPDFEQPVISIVFELGEELPNLPEAELTQLVQPGHWELRKTRSSTSKPGPRQDDRHYSFVARGCSPDTYKAIPQDAKTCYDIILASGGLKDDFPRASHEASWSAVRSLRPNYTAEVCWDEWDEWDEWDRMDSEKPSSSSTGLGTKGGSKETTSHDSGGGRQTNATGTKSGQKSSGGSKAKKRKAWRMADCWMSSSF
ncbi:hypothetical protein B0J17DRAFT_631300 [Rhizoctonia solani]|nr:hypothetical protein B0J17DRAFT_631300 [Rhizoctonia solani]